MKTALDEKIQISHDEMIKIASDCLKEKVNGVAKISRGANSRVYQVLCSPKQYVVKFYFQHPSDSRDRLGVEFKSLTFLWEQGLRMIPRPVTLSQEHQCAFYQFIKGTSPGNDISSRDIDDAVSFLDHLKNLSIHGAGLNFSGASEAFFCARDIVSSLRERLKRLYFEDRTGEYSVLHRYLRDEFEPLLEEVENWSKEYMASQGVLWHEELPSKYRTLSPSDFGFHNALRTIPDSLVFLDFEYFGWDDPAKLVSDFLLHPAMDMTENTKKYFVNRMNTVFGKDPYFKTRLKSVFPLFGLKWSLILLNEFIPAESQRREFSRAHTKDKTTVRLEQLVKAKSMSDKIKRMYKDFPYGS